MKDALSIHLKGGFPNECFLIHGYTGCPGDFNKLPQYLHENCNLDVKVILLKGHGQEVSALDGIEFEDILEQVEDELKKDMSHYQKIMMGGISFGAQLALYLASKYPVQSVFSACIPYKLRFPFNIPGIDIIGKFKKYWEKSIGKNEWAQRRNQFYCKKIHINGFKIVKKANGLLNASLSDIHCPILSIHTLNDPLTYYKGPEFIERAMGCSHKKKYFEGENHNVFYAKKCNRVYREIGKFINKIPENQRSKKVVAIVPAYNEAVHIPKVLEVLTRTKMVHEIIVVDDGSTDATSLQASKFPQVKLLRNKKNMGKAYCLERAIKSTDAEILFFCDADLEELTPEIVEKIIQPVLNGDHAMYIGIRDNYLQNVVQLFALNSGERALTRELWNKVPDYFKCRYRIEAGLNFIANQQEGGYGWKRFHYYQTIKEKKYGFLKGTILRWWMNFDVAYAYIRTVLPS